VLAVVGRACAYNRAAVSQVFAQAILESLSLSRVEAAIGNAWASLPREVRDAPPWVWILGGGIAMLLFLRIATRSR
jgi:hypothetical protein